MMATRALLACVALGGACLSWSQVTKTAGGYLMRAKYRSGASLHYQSLTAVQNYNVKADITLDVLAVKNGIATVQINQGPSLGGPQNIPLSNARVSTLRLDKLNRAIGSTTNAQLVALFPAKPVKLGAVWGGVSTFSLGKGSGGALETDYHFSGIKQDRGKRLAVLDVLMKGFASGSGSLLIDCDDGSLLVSVLNLKIRTTQTDATPVQVQIKRTNSGARHR